MIDVTFGKTTKGLINQSVIKVVAGRIFLRKVNLIVTAISG